MTKTQDNRTENVSHPNLSENDIHVWKAWLDQSAGQMEPLALTLSADEHIRAHKFHFDTDRKRFVAGRGILRSLIGRYLGISPRRIKFDYNEWGKPQLKHPEHSSLSFNLAHSQDLALFAFAHGRRIGIDLECVRPLPDMEQLISQFFSEQEKKEWSALPVKAQPTAFYRGWTLKEAFLKALGEGLTRPTTGFTVPLAPGELVRLIEVQWDANEVNRWELVNLEPAPGYIAALAVERHSPSVFNVRMKTLVKNKAKNNWHS